MDMGKGSGHKGGRREERGREVARLKGQCVCVPAPDSDCIYYVSQRQKGNKKMYICISKVYVILSYILWPGFLNQASIIISSFLFFGMT